MFHCFGSCFLLSNKISWHTWLVCFRISATQKITSPQRWRLSSHQGRWAQWNFDYYYFFFYLYFFLDGTRPAYLLSSFTPLSSSPKQLTSWAQLTSRCRQQGSSSRAKLPVWRLPATTTPRPTRSPHNAARPGMKCGALALANPTQLNRTLEMAAMHLELCFCVDLKA